MSFALTLTRSVRESRTQALPAQKRKRPSPWRYFLIALICIAAVLWPIAAVVLHVPMIYQLLVGAEIGTMSFALALAEVIRKAGRNSRAEGPDRGTRQPTHAERVANSPDESSKASALEGVAAASRRR